MIMKTCGRLNLTWNIIQSLCKANKTAQTRFLFSLTGDWPTKLDTSIKKEMELYWKDYIQNHHKEKHIKTWEKRDKYYVLSMFPYPSGQLHMGHVRVYTISDTMARYHRLNGKQVIHPMGWDAFGLPAENAAIDHGQSPEQWTYSNIKSMKKQLDDLCCSFDWDREITTCHPSYYKWTQYIFLKMFDCGLAYQKNALVNWDPVDQTVLANEQIDEEGKSWRSGALVERKYLRQWYLRTTAYSKKLYDGLSGVDPALWKDIIQMQRNWIGQCNGCILYFNLKSEEDETIEEDPLSVWTDSPEGLFGISHVLLSPDHYLNNQQYHKKSIDHSGTVELSLYAIHPVLGTKLSLYVKPDENYPENTKSKLGIPGFNEGDRQFADANKITWQQILGPDVDHDQRLLNSHQFTGMNRLEAFKLVTQFAKKQNFGSHMTSSKLDDWLISRQRYWGTPIPVIHCPQCKVVPVPYDQLPVVLPIIDRFTDKADSTLKQQTDWLNVKCHKCGSDAKRETDTMDTFVDSSWYFLRYLDSSNTDKPFSEHKASSDMPVDLYIGGKEHAICHLFFARFFNHFLYDQKMVTVREPFNNLLTQGMVLGQTYKDQTTGQYLKSHQVKIEDGVAVNKSTKSPVNVEWDKMSKSKHNGVNPQDVLNEYGIDSTRLCLLSEVSPQYERLWTKKSFVPVLRGQAKVWDLVGQYVEACKVSDSMHSGMVQEDKLKYEASCFDSRNYFLKEVTYHYNVTFLLNIAITRMFGLAKDLKKVPLLAINGNVEFERSLASLIIMMSPMTPSFCSELWRLFTSVHKLTNEFDWSSNALDQKWPEVDMNYHLPLQLKINKHDTAFEEVKMPRQDLEELDQLKAQQLLETTAMFSNYLQGKDINKVEFVLFPSHHAEVRFFSHDVKISLKEARQKTQGRKKSLNSH